MGLKTKSNAPKESAKNQILDGLFEDLEPKMDFGLWQPRTFNHTRLNLPTESKKWLVSHLWGKKLIVTDEKGETW